MQPTNTYYGSTGSAPMSSAPRKNNRRRILLIAGGVFIIVLTIILGVLSSTSDRGSNQAKSLITAIAEGDVEGSRNMLSSEALKTTDDALWKKYVEENSERFGGKVELAYEQRLEGVKATEYAYNVGETGKVTRVTVVVLDEAESSASIYSVSSNPTTL